MTIWGYAKIILQVSFPCQWIHCSYKGHQLWIVFFNWTLNGLDLENEIESDLRQAKLFVEVHNIRKHATQDLFSSYDLAITFFLC